MSRIGKKPITVPAGVEVKIDGHTVTVKGPKGTLTRTLNEEIGIQMEGNEILVTRPNDDIKNRSLHGLNRTLIHNMVVGVTEGFEKKLEIQDVTPPEGITISTPSSVVIVVSGCDKEKVGQIAAEIRAWRQPEPYKGKGIRYSGEYVRRKAGKTGATK